MHSVFNKLYEVPHGHLEADDLTADEKKQLYNALAEVGMSQSTAYLRLFDKGFDQWELQGIDSIKSDFCTGNSLLQLLHTGEGFYSALTTHKGMKVQLVNLMTSLGMEHRNTISRRFDTDDWKPWERIGIREVIERFADNSTNY